MRINREPKLVGDQGVSGVYTDFVGAGNSRLPRNFEQQEHIGGSFGIVVDAVVKEAVR